MDDSLLVPAKMHDYAVGLVEGGRIIAEFLPDARIDGSPLEALEASLEREVSGVLWGAPLSASIASTCPRYCLSDPTLVGGPWVGC